MSWVVKNNGTASWRGKNSCRVSFQVMNEATGEIKREMKTFHVKSQSQAEKKRCINEFRRELENGLDRDYRNTTFEEYAAQWLKDREAGNQVAARTLSKERDRIRTINLTLGNMRIVAITRQDIKKFQTAIMTTGKDGKAPTLSGKPLSGTTAHGIRTTLHQILDEAVEDSIIAKNPCDRLKAPKVDTAEKEPLSEERAAEFRALLDSATPRPSLVGFRLCLFAGLRRGEACALKWSDFNAEDGTISISRNLCTQTLKPKAPKTKAGYRTIPLDPATIDYLKRFKRIQAPKLIALGKSVNDSCIVAKAQCEYMHPENLTRSLVRFAKANGFDGLTPHILRHTYCTLLCASSVDPKTAQYLMGHDDIRTTLGIYAHYHKKNGMKAASAIGALMDSLPTTNVIQLEKPQGRWGSRAKLAV